MSAYVINYVDGAKMMRPVLTRTDYLCLRDSDRQQATLKAVREGDTKQKHRLLQMNYSCIPGEDGALKGCKTPSRSVGMDIDFVAPENLSPEEQQAWLDEQMSRVPELVLSKREELGLLMLERSATKGYHLVFRRHEDLSQEDNLRWASQLLGVKFDEGAKDITRVFFTTSASKEDLLFLDDELFDTTPAKVLQPNSSKSKSSRGNASATTNVPAIDLSTIKYDPDAEYKGILFKDIIAKYFELYNDGKEPIVGDRNALTYELVMTLRSICDYSLEKMLTVIPNYWSEDEEGETEWLMTIENALKEPRKGMPYRLKQVLAALKRVASVKACGGTLNYPPPMPRRLPPLIRLLTSKVPTYYKPAVANAVFPALATHLHGVKFRYWDNVEREATFMNVLIGRQSIGKGCIRKPIEYIMEDIRQRDIPNRQREADWKQKNPGARQKKDPRPTDICIQMLIDNLTDAVFNQRIVDAHNNGERYIYTIVDEIEALKKVTSRGKLEEVGLLIRKAFDNSLAGQERVGADSVSGIAPLRWNFNASTTPPNARKFFTKMVNDGTVSRLDISTIILKEEEEYELPVFGRYDDAFANELKPYIERLEAASGLIECAQARTQALGMAKDNAALVELLESQAFRVMSYRSSVIAWLKGMVLYIANGYRWDKSIADFVHWSQQYSLWCKLHYFGEQLETELQTEREMELHSGPKNLLNLLPDEFTREQYRQMRVEQGHASDGDSTLRSWVKRNHIYFDDATGRYCKTKEYLQRFGKPPYPD